MYTEPPTYNKCGQVFSLVFLVLVSLLGELILLQYLRIALQHLQISIF